MNIQREIGVKSVLAVQRHKIRVIFTVVSAENGAKALFSLADKFNFEHPSEFITIQCIGDNFNAIMQLKSSLRIKHCVNTVPFIDDESITRRI